MGVCVTDVFLSYKAEDRSRVAPLVRALEDDGLSVWWDECIGGGDQWRDTILRHLEAAHIILVVWSKQSTGPQGSFVRDEATRALKLGTYVPVRIDAVDPPLGFGETQALDLLRWSGKRSDAKYQALLAAVTAKLREPRFPTTGDRARMPRFNRRAMIAGIAGLAVSGGIFAAWKGLRSKGGANDRSVAVLPFANLSGDPNQAYFSDGIAEELRSILARIPGLQVVARTSSEAVRNVDAKAAAAKLHVSNILAGSVRRSPEMIRIGAQLIDGTTGTEQWSEVYDRPIGDMLKIQTEIAVTVAQSLSIHIEGAEERALKEGGTANASAQDLLLKGQGVVWRADDEASLRRAMEYVNRAIALDPRYADAIAAKSAILNAFGSFFASSAQDGQGKLQDAARLARDAIAIAPQSGAGHAALAAAFWNSLNLREGLAEFEKAATLSGGMTNFFNAFDSHALALACCRRFDAALARSEHLVATDALNPNAFLTKGGVLVHARRYAEAHDVFVEAAALGPDLRWPRAFQGFCLMQTGRLDEARKTFDSIPGPGPWLSYAAVLAWRQNRADDTNRLMGMMRADMGDAGYFQYAEVFAQQGRKDEALRALERGWNTRDTGMPFINVDVLLDPIRDDPRFRNIVAQLNFPGPA